MGRARHGDGWIGPRQLADGTTVWDLRITVDGEAYNRYGLESQEAAIAERDKARASRSIKALARQRKLRLPELVRMWMDAHPDKAGSTLASYEATFQNHIEPRLNVQVEKLTVTIMNDFMRELPKHLPKYARGGYSSGKRVSDMVKATLRWAASPSVRLIEENPLRDSTIKLPKKNLPRQAVRREDFPKLMAAAEGLQSQHLWLMLGATGARKGEITALLWSDIDFVRNMVSISKISTPESKGSVVEDRVKMNQEREIPLEESIAEYFLNIKQSRQAKLTDPVFPAPRKGGTIGHGTINKWWYRDCKKAGLSNVTIHSLRHMFTTMMIDAKEDVNVVSKILGHSSAIVTLGIYKHVTEAQKSEAIRSMGGLLTRRVG